MDKELLIKLQKEKSHKMLADADEMVKQKRWDIAANRYYYATTIQRICRASRKDNLREYLDIIIKVPSDCSTPLLTPFIFVIFLSKSVQF